MVLVNSWSFLTRFDQPGRKSDLMEKSTSRGGAQRRKVPDVPAVELSRLSSGDTADSQANGRTDAHTHTHTNMHTYIHTHVYTHTDRQADRLGSWCVHFKLIDSKSSSAFGPNPCWTFPQTNQTQNRQFLFLNQQTSKTSNQHFHQQPRHPINTARMAHTHTHTHTHTTQ